MCVWVYINIHCWCECVSFVPLVVVVVGDSIFFASHLAVKLLTQSPTLTIAYNKVMSWDVLQSITFAIISEIFAFEPFDILHSFKYAPSKMNVSLRAIVAVLYLPPTFFLLLYTSLYTLYIRLFSYIHIYRLYIYICEYNYILIIVSLLYRKG